MQTEQQINSDVAEVNAKQQPAERKVSDTLKAAKALIEKEENWLQGRFSKDNKHCSLGALCAVEPLGSDNYTPARKTIGWAAGGALVKFNDTHTHAEVMAMWDKAIALALEEEAMNDGRNGMSFTDGTAQ